MTTIELGDHLHQVTWSPSGHRLFTSNFDSFRVWNARSWQYDIWQTSDPPRATCWNETSDVLLVRCVHCGCVDDGVGDGVGVDDSFNLSTTQSLHS